MYLKSVAVLAQAGWPAPNTKAPETFVEACLRCADQKQYGFHCWERQIQVIERVTDSVAKVACNTFLVSAVHARTQHHAMILTRFLIKASFTAQFACVFLTLALCPFDGDGWCNRNWPAILSSWRPSGRVRDSRGPRSVSSSQASVLVVVTVKWFQNSNLSLASTRCQGKWDPSSSVALISIVQSDGNPKGKEAGSERLLAEYDALNHHKKVRTVRSIGAQRGFWAACGDRIDTQCFTITSGGGVFKDRQNFGWLQPWGLPPKPAPAGPCQHVACGESCSQSFECWRW